ncbi:protein disulfide oxidoreductase [Photobacterium leiognathi]|uniref:protein disulfide oxidoreductase n=1 Tax=Photobacterium leiognathi TaxID=553611 RepID=UPI0029821987|nr:protein disulfide oxidoreductase [Photobacterium leiognathi]
MSKDKKKPSKLKEYIALFIFVFVIIQAIDMARTSDIPIEKTPVTAGISLNKQHIDAIEQSKDKAVLVYFWATWCVACKFVTPIVNCLSDDYSVVGISFNSGDDHRVQRYIKAKGYHFSTINDANNQISRDWGVQVAPTLIVLKDGEVKSTTSGLTTPMGILGRMWLANIK